MKKFTKILLGAGVIATGIMLYKTLAEDEAERQDDKVPTTFSKEYIERRRAYARRSAAEKRNTAPEASLAAEMEKTVEVQSKDAPVAEGTAEVQTSPEASEKLNDHPDEQPTEAGHET